MIRVQCLLVPLALAGCATVAESERIASAECKVYLHEAGTLPNSAPVNQSELDRQYAVARLSTSELRWRMLNRPFWQTGLIEEALRDCERSR